MAERTKLSQLKSVVTNLEAGLKNLPYEQFEAFGSVLDDISKIYSKVEDERLDEAEREEQAKLDRIKQRKAEKKKS